MRLGTIRVFLVLLVAAVVSGCAAQTVKLDSAALTQIQSKRLALVTEPRRPIKIMTPTKATLSSGLLAAMIVDAISEDIGAKHNIPDPAKKVGQKLQSMLTARHGMSPVSSADRADLLLKVSGFSELRYGAVKWMSYAPVLVVTTELVDARTKKVLSKGQCAIGGTGRETPWRSYNDHLINGAANLKKDLDTLTEMCARSIMKKAMG